MTQASLKPRARSFFAAYARGEADVMRALCSPDATFGCVPLGDAGRGRVDPAAAELWQSYVDAFEGFRPEVPEVWEDADQRTVIARTVNRGVQRQDVAGIATKGSELAAPHLFVLQFDGQDRIGTVTAFWDNMTVFNQIGWPAGFSVPAS